MLAAFFFSARLYGQLWALSLRRGKEFGRLSWRGYLLRVALFLLATPIWLLHWFCLLLDELLFPAYRYQSLQRPLFIVGVPRSGTTHLHRTLSEDQDSFSSVSTWEVFLAPSIVQRYFWLGLAQLDQLVGGPFKFLVGKLQKRLFAGMEGVHDIELGAAEEDYLLLLPMLSCFILFLPFTNAEHIWRLSRFDQDMPERDRKLIMNFYRAMLQKHMYVFGGERRYLSKNAAFASWTRSLEDEFEDAQLVVCLREPEAAVSSLLGSVAGGAEFFELELPGKLSVLLTESMAGYYSCLLGGVEERLEGSAEGSVGGGVKSPAQRWPVVDMHELRKDLPGTVETLYHRLSIPLTEEFSVQLTALARQAENYQSQTQPVQPQADELESFEAQFRAYYEFKGDGVEKAAEPQHDPSAQSEPEANP